MVINGLVSFSLFDIKIFYLVSYVCFSIKDFLILCYISCKCISSLLFAFSFVLTDFSPWSFLFFAISIILFLLRKFITSVKPHDHTCRQNGNSGRIRLVESEKSLRRVLSSWVQGVCVNPSHCHRSGNRNQDQASAPWILQPERTPVSRWCQPGPDRAASPAS